MGGRPGKGAGIGLGISAVLLVIMFSPRILAGDTYELSDPLLFFGVPLLVLGSGVGALVGLLMTQYVTALAKAGPAGSTGRAGSIVAAVAMAAVVLALWTILWAVGVIAVSPLGIG